MRKPLKKIKTWSRNNFACIKCKENSRRHAAKELCRSCYYYNKIENFTNAQKENFIEKRHKSYLKNKEARLLYQKNWRKKKLADPEIKLMLQLRAKEYYQSNKKKSISYNKKYYLKNREKALEYQRRYYIKLKTKKIANESTGTLG
jgi:hypothetical protein